MRTSTVKSCNGILFLGVMGFLLAACNPSRNLTDPNLSSHYKITETTPLPFYTVYQYATDSLKLCFTIPSRTPMLEQVNGKPADDLPYRMHVSIYSRSDRNTIIDSATYHYVSKLRTVQSDLHGSIDLYTGEPAGSTLSVTIHDITGNTSNSQFFELIPAWPPGSFHFLLKDSAGYPMNIRYLNARVPFSIESSILLNQEVKVRYYRDSFPVALPPFALLPANYLNYSYEADSVFSITFKDGKTPLLQYSRPGLYHLSPDPGSRTGHTLFITEGSFPWITQPVQMVHPLRYIATDKEFIEMLSSTDYKQAVDQFWITRTGNEARARKLIREYYRRVEKANYLFTSYQEGWKTDRGMIYILYGPPGMVRRDERSEVWTYGDSKNIFSLSFVFLRMNNPFTDNDYLLERNANYKSGWHQMVNSWRR